MASNTAATISSLLGSSKLDDDEEILKHANADLKKDKHSQQALHTRVVALIKLDRFEDALRALDDGGDKLTQRCELEKAYALYKIGKLEDAWKIVQDSDKKSRGVRHVAAQVAYREEKFQEAAQIYEELSAQDAAIEGEDNDIRINSSAVDAQLGALERTGMVETSRKRPRGEDLEAFETSYNAACGYISRGELEPGSILLKRARDLCEALEELSDEEKKAEVLPIMVQQVYVLTRMGKLEEAEALQKMINVSDVPELPTRAIAQNNFLAVRAHHENPYLTRRVFDSIPILSKTDKLFEHQASILQRNKQAIDLLMLKYDGVERSTAKLLAKNPSATTSSFINSLSALNVAAHAKCQASKTSLKQVLPLLERRPKDVGLVMTVIQLYILANNPTPAIGVLESFFGRLEESTTPADHDVRFAPGLVSLAVSLYRSLGRKAPVKQELAKAASYWQRKPKTSKDLLRAAGVSLLDSAKLEDISTAGDIFRSLRQEDPSDRIAIAGLVASHAVTDLPTVQAELEMLTPVDRLISGIDASLLEDAGIASISVTRTEASKKRPAPVQKEKLVNKKTRKSKMPKDFEPGKIMDPERWLPLKDRSSYRPKGKKGKKKALEATQGGVVKDEESLELVGGAGAVKVEKAPVSGGKAKKKKGKK